MENGLIEEALQQVTERENFEMSARGKIGIATYEEVIDTLRDPERLLIDVREASEVAGSGQIPTSINIPLEIINQEFRLSSPAFSAKYMRSKPGIYDEIIFYCKFGDQAQQAAEIAVSLGYRK
jgi:thiosulfate:glutathione sulfurtransferase